MPSPRLCMAGRYALGITEIKMTIEQDQSEIMVQSVGAWVLGLEKWQ